MGSIHFTLKGAGPLALATALVGAAPVGQANAASVFTGAYSVAVDVFALGGSGGDFGPFNGAAGTSPGPYNDSNTLPSYSFSQVYAASAGDMVIVDGEIDISSGLASVSASSPNPGSPTGMATSTIDNLSFGLGYPGSPGLLDVSATTVSSTSAATGVGALSATGSSTVENLVISGPDVATPVSLPGTVSPSVDDVIYSVPGLEIALNYQEPASADPAAASILTLPLVIVLRGYQSLYGDVAFAASGAIISPSADTSLAFQPAMAQSAVPEPLAWAELILGATWIGALARRRWPQSGRVR
jgi:hypothetical protein